jgi:putative redox protein
MTTATGSVHLQWIGSTLMAGIDSRGNPLVIGSRTDQEPKWSGLKPSDLLLLAAASCSTYDVVAILAKQREPLESLEVTCTGVQESEPPYRFLQIHLHYVFKGDLAAERVTRAIALSEEKYCCITNTLRPVVAITSDFEIIGEGTPLRR